MVILSISFNVAAVLKLQNLTVNERVEVKPIKFLIGFETKKRMSK